MNIHEYQAKQLFRSYRIPVVGGQIATTPEEAEKAAKELGGNLWVVKAQIHAGGRGKGGGVKIAKTTDEVKSFTKDLIGFNLITPQTDPSGKTVNKVYIEQGCDIAKEYYFSMLLNRENGVVTIIASSEGGMDIEEVAETMPEKIITQDINPSAGFLDFEARRVAFKLGLSGKAAIKASSLFVKLYKLYIDTDASLVEINPLVVTKANDVVALDAKMSFDSNALFKHPQILELRDKTEEDPAEIEASEYDLAFIKLDGEIGCLVNGAGLAMATLDIIKLYGSSPANFLDVGGGANKEKVTAAFKIILKDKNVKSILVNIFGGIMKCDIIAEGVIAAANELSLKVPLVVRLEGTNVELGKKILKESGLNIIAADDLDDAAKKAVEAAKKG